MLPLQINMEVDGGSVLYTGPSMSFHVNLGDVVGQEAHLQVLRSFCWDIPGSNCSVETAVKVSQLAWDLFQMRSLRQPRQLHSAKRTRNLDKGPLQ